MVQGNLHDARARPEPGVPMNILPAFPRAAALAALVAAGLAPDARPQNYRFALNMEACAKCQRAEYACTCDE